jgi:hypothetical protein
MSKINIMAGTAAAAVLAFGAWAIGKSSAGSDNTAGAAPAAQVGDGSSTAGRAPWSGAQGGAQQAPPGFGAPVTGAAAKKAGNAALAKYPGTVERVMQLQDGSYVVHVITSNGEQHVTVSKQFKVTGAQEGGPGGGAPPTAPDGSSGAPSTGTAS